MLLLLLGSVEGVGLLLDDAVIVELLRQGVRKSALVASSPVRGRPGTTAPVAEEISTTEL